MTQYVEETQQDGLIAGDELEAEFAAFEAASDYDLWRFERELDMQTDTASSSDWNIRDWWDGLPGDAVVQVYKRDVGRDRLVELMNEIGNKMFPIMVRFDPERDFDNFTVVIGAYGRIGDGPDPVEIIEQWLKQRE